MEECCIGRAQESIWLHLEITTVSTADHITFFIVYELQGLCPIPRILSHIRPIMPLLQTCNDDIMLSKIGNETRKTNYLHLRADHTQKRSLGRYEQSLNDTKTYAMTQRCLLLNMHVHLRL